MVAVVAPNIMFNTTQFWAIIIVGNCIVICQPSSRTVGRGVYWPQSHHHHCGKSIVCFCHNTTKSQKDFRFGKKSCQMTRSAEGLVNEGGTNYTWDTSQASHIQLTIVKRKSQITLIICFNDDSSRQNLYSWQRMSIRACCREVKIPNQYGGVIL